MSVIQYKFVVIHKDPNWSPPVCLHLFACSAPPKKSCPVLQHPSRLGGFSVADSLPISLLFSYSLLPGMLSLFVGNALANVARTWVVSEGFAGTARNERMSPC